MKKLTLTLCGMLLCASAQAGVVLVGNPSAQAITASQASKLYLGKLKSLPSGAKATLIELQNGDPLRIEFHDKVTGKTESQVEAYWSRMMFTGKARPPIRLENTKQVKEEISYNPNAIGYIDEADVDSTVKVLLKL